MEEITAYVVDFMVIMARRELKRMRKERDKAGYEQERVAIEKEMIALGATIRNMIEARRKHREREVEAKINSIGGTD